MWLFLYSRQNHCNADLQTDGSPGESPLRRRSLASSNSLISLISCISFAGSCSVAANSQSCLHFSLSFCIHPSQGKMLISRPITFLMFDARQSPLPIHEICGAK